MKELNNKMLNIPENEPEGISPLLWGPSAWHLLHSIAATYPNKPTELDIKRYYTFIISFAYVLPCPTCREHFKKTLHDKEFNINHLADRETFTKFVFDVHNVVNERLHKPRFDTPEHYEYVKNKYNVLKQL